MGWRNQKKQGGSTDDESGESLSDMLRAKPSEADQLDSEGLELSLERLQQSLRRGEEILRHENYRCIVPIGSTRGPVCCVSFRQLGSTGRLTAIPDIWGGLSTPTDGPCSLLCAHPVLGAMPWVCAEHWLVVRKYVPDVERRMRKEFRRSMKKG